MPCLRSRVLSRRCFQSGDLGVHVGEDGGNGGLFVKGRDLNVSTDFCNSTDV